MAPTTIHINRAPVLTLWATVVAESVGSNELPERAFQLYEKFRPKIPAGVSGWGAKGELDLECLRSMAVKSG